MPTKVYTIETRLPASINSELRIYLDDYVKEYNKCYRDMWHQMTASDFKTKYPKESNFVTDICNKYGYLKRTINAIRYDIKGRMKSYKELKKTELKQLETKIQTKQVKISQIIDKLDKLKPIVTNNKARENQLEKYRNLKKSLYYQKNKLNKMIQAKNKLIYQIENNIYSVGFGGKHTFDNQNRLQENRYKTHKKWYNNYVKLRDKNIFYLGSSDETFGNQMFQMTYNSSSDDFIIKVRKENHWCKSTIEQAISKIVSYALTKGKDIIIEDLDFKKKKSTTSKRDKNKKYNKMLHLFDYSRYKEIMENSCHRNRVYLNKINPYMTSQIGKQKYSNSKKLNIHQAASYVIARRGQGFKDKYKKIA